MTDMPEKIWADGVYPRWYVGRNFEEFTEYVRADKYAELEAENKRLEKELSYARLKELGKGIAYARLKELEKINDG